MNICNSLRSSSSFEKWPKASLPVCSEMFLIHHCKNLWCPSQIVDISIAASILNVVISNFSCFQIVLSLRNVNYKQWQIKAHQIPLQCRYVMQGDYSQGNVFASSTFNTYMVVKVLFSLHRDWNKSITCNGSPFHLGAVKKEYGFPYLELSRHALKKELLKAKFLIKARPSNSSSFDKVINIDCKVRAKFIAKHNEMKSHYAKSFSACVVVFFSSILTRRFDFIRRDKTYLIKKSVNSLFLDEYIMQKWLTLVLLLHLSVSLILIECSLIVKHEMSFEISEVLLVGIIRPFR